MKIITLESLLIIIGPLRIVRLAGVRSAVRLTATKDLYENVVFIRTTTRLPPDRSGRSERCGPTGGQPDGRHTHYADMLVCGCPPLTVNVFTNIRAFN
ncbi:hypothetical protein B5X24_HaOG212903 [Helicoverpa armigera]|nr:hypothetical protein B5X24_HaOG212903 [Helicoverpa armigera]